MTTVTQIFGIKNIFDYVRSSNTGSKLLKTAF